MTRGDLLALADRVEALVGPDALADLDIWCAINGHDDYHAIKPGMRSGAAAYTASLDAAMALIAGDAFWRLGNDGEGPDVSAFKATVTSGNGPTLSFHDAVAATPALALTAAALRARALDTPAA